MSLTLVSGARARLTIPVFLAPAFAENIAATSASLTARSFSSSTCLEQRAKKGKINRQRGVSALRSTGSGPLKSLPMRYRKESLPAPAEDYEARRKEYDDADDEHGLSPDHGLWQFFRRDKIPLTTPLEEGSHGRAWTMSELSQKSFDDLWRLYWVCVKEANQIVTRDYERSRVYAGYGGLEAETRLKTVRSTQTRIRKVLVQRHHERSMAQMYLEQQDLKDIFPDEAYNVELQLREEYERDQEMLAAADADRLHAGAEPRAADVGQQIAEAGETRSRTQ